ncbi:hypothetical protein OTU49_010380, partial [Cherax quadricarinatus]
MGLIIEKQKTKEDDGRGNCRGESAKIRRKEKVTQTKVKKSSIETKSKREIKIKETEIRDVNATSEMVTYRRTRDSIVKSTKSTVQESRGNTPRIDKERKKVGSKGDKDVKLSQSWIAEEEDLVAFVLVSGSCGPDEGQERDYDDSCCSDGRLQEMQPRYQSLRPTSLETIIEDGPCSYSFQEAIKSSTQENRACYRDCRESLDHFLDRTRDSQQKISGIIDSQDNIVLAKEETGTDIPVEDPGGNVLADGEAKDMKGNRVKPQADTVVKLEESGARLSPLSDEYLSKCSVSELLECQNTSQSFSLADTNKTGDGLLLESNVRESINPGQHLDYNLGSTVNENRSHGDSFIEFHDNDIIYEKTYNDGDLNKEVDGDASITSRHCNSTLQKCSDENDTGGRDSIGHRDGLRCLPDNENTERQHLSRDNTQISSSQDQCEGVVASDPDYLPVVKGTSEDSGVHADYHEDDTVATDADGNQVEVKVEMATVEDSEIPFEASEKTLDAPEKEALEASKNTEYEVFTEDEKCEYQQVMFTVYIQNECLAEMMTGKTGEARTEENKWEESVANEKKNSITEERKETVFKEGNEAMKEERYDTPTEEDIEVTEAVIESTVDEMEEATEEREEARELAKKTVMEGHWQGSEAAVGPMGPQYQREFTKAIQSLDSLNDQIVEFIFSGSDFDDHNGGSPKQREALKSSMALMRRLLVDAQSKFRKMVEDNKQLASRIDGDLQTAHQEVNLLRQELADTNRRITQLQVHNHHDHDGCSPDSPTTPTTPTINGSHKYHSESSSNQLVEELSQLRLENEKLAARNRSLQSEVEELRKVKENKVEEDLQLKPRINEMTIELTHAKEALSALKADRKRLKAEKFDLLNQMKQLYATLEDKEKELRDFIRNYEQVHKQLTSVGYYSDAESVRTNGLTTPTASTPACSPLPLSTPTPTPNGRGSSADSGVRLSSDRESTASHDGGAGSPKESPSLSPLYATPVCLKREEQSGDNTPTSAQTPTAATVNSPTISGLANSSANAGGLSRSAEQLCERLSEAADSSKGRGSSTLIRKGHKGGGTWGSISRVFARQKKRAAFDASLYDGNGSDKRASWSPSTSLCASPLTEESYSEKLRLLEEAQHIPLERWKAPTVLAWLEVTLGMPQYGAMCAENVRSGKVLLELSDSELEAGLGITHPMHRKKLRLAIEELREPRVSRFPRISALGHTWVSSEWLPDLGLPHYSDTFANNLVDGRLLEALTKKELEKYLGVHRKFHQASIIHGVHLLRIVRFDRQVLAERRRQCDLIDTDPVVWTNMRWVRWARSIDLAEYADNLKDSGVHGALVVLESSFTADTMATALGIPQSKNIIRRHLATELESLVNPARQQLDEQARYAKLERRRQEKLAAGGSLGRSFSRSYGTGLERGEKDKRRASLRGSLSRALGLRLR